jgi:hypothetical protein
MTASIRKSPVPFVIKLRRVTERSQPLICLSLGGGGVPKQNPHIIYLWCFSDDSAT